MHTINFKIPLINIEGKEDQNATLASVLAEMIGTETEGKTLKLYGWYKNLHEDGKLNLDDADKQDLIKLISENKRLFIFVKGQLLEQLK